LSEIFFYWSFNCKTSYDSEAIGLNAKEEANAPLK